MPLPTSLSFALLLLFSLACRAKCGDEFFIAHANSTIQLTGIRPGNKLVFEYVCQTKNFENTIARDIGVRESVLFEVDAGNHAFYLADEDLRRAKVLVSRRCHCPPLKYDHLEGVIEGRRIGDDQWEITIQLAAIDAKGKEVLKLSSTGVYKLQAKGFSTKQ